MTYGTFKVLRGVPAAAGGALPTIVMSDLDKILAGVSSTAGIKLGQFDIDPAKLSAPSPYTLFGKARGLGKTLYAQRATVGKIDAEPLFNNKPAINCLASTGSGGSDLTMDWAPPAGGSFTWFAVVTIDAVLKATPRTARIITVVNPVGGATLAVMQFTSTGSLNFGNASGLAGASSGNVPAANVPFVVAGQFDIVAGKARIYVNNNTVINEIAMTAPAFETSHITGIGGASRITTGNTAWLGKIARIDSYQGALSPAQLTTVINALKAEYSVTA